MFASVEDQALDLMIAYFDKLIKLACLYTIKFNQYIWDELIKQLVIATQEFTEAISALSLRGHSLQFDEIGCPKSQRKPRTG